MSANQKLDTYFKTYEWNHNLAGFVTAFFGHDRTWVKNALKCVLPASVSDEALEKAAWDLWSYAQHHTLNLEASSTEENQKKATEILEAFFANHDVD